MWYGVLYILIIIIIIIIIIIVIIIIIAMCGYNIVIIIMTVIFIIIIPSPCLIMQHCLSLVHVSRKSGSIRTGKDLARTSSPKSRGEASWCWDHYQGNPSCPPPKLTPPPR